MQKTELIEKIFIEQIEKFVLSHKQKDGGFSFSKDTPSTIEDTFYALQILSELKIPYNENTTFQFIKSLEKDNLMVKHLYQISEISKSYNIEIVWLDQMIKKQNLPKNMAKNLEHLYYMAKLGKLNNQKIIYNIKISDNEKLLSNLCRKIIILKKSGIKLDEQKIINQIQDFQRGDGGFSFTKYSSPSYIEQIYLAIEALSELNSKPRKIKECIDLIESFKSKDGGYGRQVSAVPTLEATYYAIISLKRLME